MMSYEYTDARTGQRYCQEGRRVYRITPRGNLVWDHDAVLDPPPAWWRRALAAPAAGTAGEKAAARAAAKVEIDKLVAAGDLAGLWTFAMPGASLDDIRGAIKSVEAARFDAERETWTAAHGSAHLRRCRDAGYDCIRLYATERAALEAPGFVVDVADKAEWSARSCPSAAAIDAVDEARAAGLSDPTVVWLKHPPRARVEPWQDDEFEPCEAVVVRKWLYRYDLVKIVA